VITWPAVERSWPRSIGASPVTHTAEAEVNRASTAERGFEVAEKGSQSTRPPRRMIPAKLRMKILSGERWREINSLRCQG